MVMSDSADSPKTSLAVFMASCLLFTKARAVCEGSVPRSMREGGSEGVELGPVVGGYEQMCAGGQMQC